MASSNAKARISSLLANRIEGRHLAKLDLTVAPGREAKEERRPQGQESAEEDERIPNRIGLMLPECYPADDERRDAEHRLGPENRAHEPGHAPPRHEQADERSEDADRRSREAAD